MTITGDGLTEDDLERARGLVTKAIGVIEPFDHSYTPTEPHMPCLGCAASEAVTALYAVDSVLPRALSEIARLRARLAEVEGAVDRVLGARAYHSPECWFDECNGIVACTCGLDERIEALRAARHGPTEHKEKP